MALMHSMNLPALIRSVSFNFNSPFPQFGCSVCNLYVSCVRCFFFFFFCFCCFMDVIPPLITFLPSKQSVVFLTWVHFEWAPLQRRLCDWEVLYVFLRVFTKKPPSSHRFRCLSSACQRCPSPPLDTDKRTHGPRPFHTFCFSAFF